MNTNPFYIAKLLVRKFNTSISSNEQSELESWIKQNPKNASLAEELVDSEWDENHQKLFYDFDENLAWKSITAKRRKRSWLSILKAASIIVVFLGVGGLIWNFSSKEDNQRIVKAENSKYKNDVLPAQKGAHIVTSNGENFAVQENLKISSSGIFSDESDQIFQVNASKNAIMWNKLMVPAANYFKMTLSDGTDVWVNANSELSFPTVFSENERRVKLKGEAYFEVAHDANKPFYVESSGTTVKVLGTHFNVSARTSKSIITLAEGKVEVSAGEHRALLMPGQQSKIVAEDIKVTRADLTKELAWKNNTFYFKGDNIVEIAHQLETWYDVNISFSKNVSLTNTYSGEIRRNANLTEVLTMLEFVSGLEFKIDGNKLLILNKYYDIRNT